MTDELEFGENKLNKERKSAKTSNQIIRYMADPLASSFGNYTVGKGLDPSRGEYRSYYDLWDIAPTKERGAADQSMGIGKPIPFYDRVYLNDYYGISPESAAPDEGDYYGGWLQDITVMPEDKNASGQSLANGGKVNRFDGLTGSSTLENQGINDADLIAKYGFRYVPVSSIYNLLNDDELNYNINNEGMTLREYYKKYPTAKIAVNNNNRIVTANDLRELEQSSILSDLADFTPENWLSLRVDRPDGTKFDQDDVNALNSHRSEYKNIELASKQNGSWLKMPNDSVWNGDPRIWIMM